MISSTSMFDWMHTTSANSQLSPEIKFTRFHGLGREGDYLFMIRQGVYDESRFFFFPDNTNQRGTSGAACIRGMPGAIGIPTIHKGRAFPNIIAGMNYIDKAFDDSMIEACVREGSLFHFPVGDDVMELDDGRTVPVLGCGTYNVPLDVRQYITKKFITLVEKYARSECAVKFTPPPSR